MGITLVFSFQFFCAAAVAEHGVRSSSVSINAKKPPAFRFRILIRGTFWVLHILGILLQSSARQLKAPQEQLSLLQSSSGERPATPRF